MAAVPLEVTSGTHQSLPRTAEDGRVLETDSGSHIHDPAQESTEVPTECPQVTRVSSLKAKPTSPWHDTCKCTHMANSRCHQCVTKLVNLGQCGEVWVYFPFLRLQKLLLDDWRKTDDSNSANDISFHHASWIFGRAEQSVNSTGLVFQNVEVS